MFSSYTTDHFLQWLLTFTPWRNPSKYFSYSIEPISTVWLYIIIISLYDSTAGQKPPNLLHSSRSDACLFQVTLAKLPISSLHLVLYLACLLLPSLSYHSATVTVHLLYQCFITFYYVHFFLLIVLKMSSTLVCSLIMMFSSYLSMFCQAFFSPFPFGHWSIRSRTFVRLQVSDPYVRTCRIHWLYTFLFPG